MPRGELENRDRDEGIGDLPEDLGLERRELFGDVPLRRGVPHDMRSNASRRDAAAQAPLGTPSLDFDVRSIYDSRPVNTRDFNLWFEALTDSTPVDLAVFFRCFAVPVGYVAVVREVTVLFNTAGSLGTTPFDGTLALALDGNFYDPMDVIVGPAIGTPETEVAAVGAIPWRSGEATKTFMVADQSQFVGIFLGIEGNPVITGGIYVGFYGNFLQKTNVPANFQIANKAGTRGPPVTLPPQFDSQLPRPRRQRVPFPRVPIIKK